MTRQRFLNRKSRVFTFLRKILLPLVLVIMGLAFFLPSSPPVLAHGCTGCSSSDVSGAIQEIKRQHRVQESIIANHVVRQFSLHRQSFLQNNFFKQEFLPALMQMTEQLSAVAMQQMFVIGTFFDAKNQLDTQRAIQELQIQAHKDYHPSEGFCVFGTNVRSLAHSENLAQFNTLALSQRSLARQLKRNNTNAETRAEDKEGRWRQFRDQYCDPKDNNWTGVGTGLEKACRGNGPREKRNIDIDYTRLIDHPMTLDVNFADGEFSDNEKAGNEEDVIAMANNLYGHDVVTEVGNLSDKANQRHYMALRAVTAKRSVAEHSFNSIVGLKSAGTSGPDSTPDTQSWLYLGRVLTQLGMGETQAKEILGQNPSYYAQLEVMAKKLYQNPGFYADLYDKPANVQRKAAALSAIDLMLDRAIYESQLRQEMMMSVMLSTRVEPRFRQANRNLR